MEVAMQRIAVVLVFLLGVSVVVGSYVVSEPQAQAPILPAPPHVEIRPLSEPSLEDLPAESIDPKLHTLSKPERAVVDALLTTTLEYIDRETRNGCGDKEYSGYFPQHPKLALTYRGEGFNAEHWLWLRRITRWTAPAVTLVPYDQITPETYVVDVKEIQATKPIATATYRHSTFNFGSGFESQPIFGLGSFDGPPIVAGDLKTSQASFSLSFASDYAWATTLTFGKGNFASDKTAEAQDRRLITDKPEEQAAIAEGIKKFELDLPEQQRFQPVDYDDLTKGISAFDYSPRTDQLNVVKAVLNMMLPEGSIVFAGWYRTYLVEKKENGWGVLDMDTTSFTDHFAGFLCREP